MFYARASLLKPREVLPRCYGTGLEARWVAFGSFWHPRTPDRRAKASALRG